MASIATVVHYNGYSLRELPGGGGNFADWEKVCWGDPGKGLMGRIPTALLIALAQDASLILWSTGATKLDDGTFESEHAFKVALERYERLTVDFPLHFESVLPRNRSRFEAWLRRTAAFDTASNSTATSMEVAIPVIDRVFGDRPGLIYTITSANHSSRTLRDALAIWRHGFAIDGFEPNPDRPGEKRVKKRRTNRLRHPHLVTIGVVAAATSYGPFDPTETRVDDLGSLLVPLL